MAKREMPDFIYYKCPECDDFTEHTILKGRMGNDNITGTFQCRLCERTFSESIKIPRQLEIPVLFSDGMVTEKTQTQLDENEIVSVDDEFYLDDGRRVCVTFIDTEDGSRKNREIGSKIKKLWVKQFDIISVKISVNDNHRTLPFRIDAEPDDEFTVGMILSFENYDAVVHAIKTKTRLVRRGDAEAREIRRVYAKMRPKNYAVMEFEEEEFEFDESEYQIDDEEDDN